MQITDEFIDDQTMISRAVEAFGKTYKDSEVTWGRDDCSMFPAAWLKHFATEIRRQRWRGLTIPAYNSEEEANALIEAAGGLVNVWDAIATDARLMPIDPMEVLAGDIGIVRMSHLGPQGCIFVKYGVGAMVRRSPGTHTIGMRRQHIMRAYRLP